jgi:hypothetical protein
VIEPIIILPQYYAERIIRCSKDYGLLYTRVDDKDHVFLVDGFTKGQHDGQHKGGSRGAERHYAAHAPSREASADFSRLPAEKRGAARTRAANDIPAKRGGPGGAGSRVAPAVVGLVDATWTSRSSRGRHGTGAYSGGPCFNRRMARAFSAGFKRRSRSVRQRADHVDDLIIAHDRLPAEGRRRVQRRRWPVTSAAS